MNSQQHPRLVEALSSDLSAILKKRTEGTLLSLIKQNKETRYFSESPVFSGFHDSVQNSKNEGHDEDQDDALIKSYYTAVPLTNYDSYEPFIKKFLESGCQEKDVQNVFAPGLPHGIGVTSSTTSGKPKYIAQYSYGSGSSVIGVQNDKGNTIKSLPVGVASANLFRLWSGLDVDQDRLNIKLASSYTSPNAVGFISEYRPFMLMHTLFALADREVEMIIASFSTAIVDMVLYMEEEWDTLVACIETGTLPDWEGIGHVREYLEPHFPPRPERAAELRAIGKATKEPGWLVKIWPLLKGICTIASGVFATPLPKIKHYVGPGVKFRSLGYFASEAPIGSVYDSSDMNLFKLVATEFIEFMDITSEGTASELLRPWQVNVGRMYEVVVTAHKGLWRYPIGDVVEIAGFDPTDGTPVIRFVERRNLVTWRAGGVLSESHITGAILAVQDTLGLISEFTTVIDDHDQSLGYLVEIYGDLDPKADEAPARLLTELFRLNEELRPVIDSQRMKPPTIRILKAGTFTEYRRWKIETNKSGPGQVKIPVVMWDETAREWIFKRVERELGCP